MKLTDDVLHWQNLKPPLCPNEEEIAIYRDLVGDSTPDPESEFKSIYNFIGEDYFPHNFNYVEQVTSENDEINGFVDLHKIRNKIEPVKSRAIEILGPEIVKEFQNAR